MTGLAPRQKELVQLLADGLSIKEAAFKMGIHNQTAKRSLSTIRDKMDAQTTYQVVYKYATKVV